MPTSQKSEPTMVSVTTTNTLQPSVEDRRGHKEGDGREKCELQFEDQRLYWGDGSRSEELQSMQNRNMTDDIYMQVTVNEVRKTTVTTKEKK